MPLGPGVKYRYKKGTHTRLAFQNGKVVEAKNMKSGATHTPEEFKEDRRKSDDETHEEIQRNLKKSLKSPKR